MYNSFMKYENIRYKFRVNYRFFLVIRASIFLSAKSNIHQRSNIHTKFRVYNISKDRVRFPKDIISMSKEELRDRKRKRHRVGV